MKSVLLGRVINVNSTCAFSSPPPLKISHRVTITCFKKGYRRIYLSPLKLLDLFYRFFRPVTLKKLAIESLLLAF